MSASGLVEADVWMQTPGNSFQPSDFWQKVCTDRALHVATMLCRVVPENVKRHCLMPCVKCLKVSVAACPKAH